VVQFNHTIKTWPHTTCLKFYFIHFKWHSPFGGNTDMKKVLLEAGVPFSAVDNDVIKPSVKLRQWNINLISDECGMSSNMRQIKYRKCRVGYCSNNVIELNLWMLILARFVMNFFLPLPPGEPLSHLCIPALLTGVEVSGPKTINIKQDLNTNNFSSNLHFNFIKICYKNRFFFHVRIKKNWCWTSSKMEKNKYQKHRVGICFNCVIELKI
jgi:hypothetical protein